MKLSIYQDPENPVNALETYSFHIKYPSSKKHQDIINMREKISTTLTMKTEDGQRHVIEQCVDGDYQRQIAKMLRTLCVIMQTLRPLPAKKFISLELGYYDELTPSNYEPPGFKNTVFDMKHLFKDTPYKHDFGTVQSDYHK